MSVATATAAHLAVLVFELLELLDFLGIGRFFATAVAAPAPSAQDGHIVDVIFVVFFFVIDFHKDAHGLAEDVDALHQAAQAVVAAHFISHLGKIAVEFLVGVGLILEAAHEPAANARNLGRIQGKVLFFGHFDGNRDEIAHPGVAAKRATADAVATQYFGLVAYADLAQLDAGAEDAGQVLDQVAEIHAAVGREVEQHLAIVERVLGVDQLHVQPVRLDLLLADAIGLALLDAVEDLGLGVLGRRHADDLLEGLGHLARVDLHGQTDHGSVLDAAHGLDDDMSAVHHFPLPGVKIVNLPSRPKPHANDAHLLAVRNGFFCIVFLGLRSCRFLKFLSGFFLRIGLVSCFWLCLSFGFCCCISGLCLDHRGLLYYLESLLRDFDLAVALQNLHLTALLGDFCSNCIHDSPVS